MVKFEVGFEIEGEAESLKVINEMISSRDLMGPSSPAQTRMFNVSKSVSSIVLFDQEELETVKEDLTPSDNTNALLICQLLPNLSPAFIINRFFPLSPQPNMKTFCRIFHFEFLPASFFPNVLVKCLREVESLITIWRNGMIGNFRKRNSSAMVLLQATSSVVTSDSRLNFTSKEAKTYVHSHLCSMVQREISFHLSIVEHDQD